MIQQRIQKIRQNAKTCQQLPRAKIQEVVRFVLAFHPCVIFRAESSCSDIYREHLKPFVSRGSRAVLSPHQLKTKSLKVEIICLS